MWRESCGSITPNRLSLVVVIRGDASDAALEGAAGGLGGRNVVGLANVGGRRAPAGGQRLGRTVRAKRLGVRTVGRGCAARSGGRTVARADFPGDRPARGRDCSGVQGKTSSLVPLRIVGLSIYR